MRRASRTLLRIVLSAAQAACVALLVTVVAAWCVGGLCDVNWSRQKHGAGGGQGDRYDHVCVSDGRVIWEVNHDPYWSWGGPPPPPVMVASATYTFDLSLRRSAGEAWNYRCEPGLRGGRFFGVTSYPNWPHDEDAGRHTAVPLSLLALALGVPSAFILRGARAASRARRRPCPGHCACGYDLRASPVRCPECGADVEATNPGADRPAPPPGDVVAVPSL